MTALRRSSTLALTLAAAAATAALGAGPAAATSPLPPKATCLPKGAKSLAASQTARVYRVAVKGKDPITSLVYGCDRTTDKRLRLVTESDDNVTSLTKVTAARAGTRYVAYVVRSEDLSCKADCPPGFEPVREEVRVADLAARTTRVVGTGLVDAKSLRITSKSVTWTEKGGAKRSAPLKVTIVRGCKPRGSTTVAESKAIRVYRVAAKRTDDDTTGHVYACLRSSGEVRKLATESDDDFVTSSGVSAAVLSGTHVVYAVTDVDASCKADCPPGYDGSTTTIHAFDFATHAHRVLDVGDATPSSIKVRGSTVTWTDRGATESATL